MENNYSLDKSSLVNILTLRYDPAINPIIPSGKFLYLARITMSVKKNPRAIPVNKEEIDK